MSDYVEVFQHAHDANALPLAAALEGKQKEKNQNAVGKSRRRMSRQH